MVVKGARPIWVLVAAALLTAAGTRAHGQAPRDPVAPLIGTWGQPPVDGQPGLTGTILAIFPDASGAIHIDATFAPSWTCTLANRTATWNGAQRRFEWPSPSPRPGTDPCWLAAERRADALDVRVSCPYTCTRPEVNAITVARLADKRLTPPADVVSTFCASVDPLRQALCTPGPIQDAIAARVKLADQVRVLDDGLDKAALEPDTEPALLDLLGQCRAARTTPCLADRLDGTNRELQLRVEARQAFLTQERRASEASAIAVSGATLPTPWLGDRFHVTDRLLPKLSFGSCTDRSCALTLEGETNYTFGYGERRGFCSLELDAFFTSATQAFGYLDVDDSGRNEADAGEFANFCRVDLRRDGVNVRVSLRGPGCAASCRDVADPDLSGVYTPAGTPSFACSDDLDSLGWIEQNVCKDAGLAALDREMADAYAAARKTASRQGAAALIASQREWLASRESCGADRHFTCLKQRYQARIATLRKP